MWNSRKLIFALFVLGALYALIVQQFFKNESRFIIQTKAIEKEFVYSFNVEFQELNLPINQSLSLHGIWFKHEKSKGIVLLFPDSDIDFKKIDISKSHYFKSGFDVLIPAYRSSAKSQGKLESEEDLYSDALNWLNFAKSQFNEQEIIIVGQGLGTAVAAHLAGNNHPYLLVLESPYIVYSEQLSNRKFWFLPYNYFTKFPLKIAENVRKSRTKVILIHAESEKEKKIQWSNNLKQIDVELWIRDSKKISFSHNPENETIFNLLLDSIHFQEQNTKLDFEN